MADDHCVESFLGGRTLNGDGEIKPVISVNVLPMSFRPAPDYYESINQSAVPEPFLLSVDRKSKLHFQICYSNPTRLRLLRPAGVKKDDNHGLNADKMFSLGREEPMIQSVTELQTS